MKLHSSIVKIFTLDENRVLLSNMNGCAQLSIIYVPGLPVMTVRMTRNLRIYDTRGSPEPVMNLHGHKNAFMPDLGIDVWQGQILAAGESAP